MDSRTAVNIEESVPGIDLLTTVRDDSITGHIDGVNGTFIVRTDSITRFLEEASINTADDLEERSLNEQSTVERVVAEVLLSSLVKISALCMERSEINVALETLFPSVFPFQVTSLSPRKF